MQNHILEPHEWFNNRFSGGTEVFFVLSWVFLLPEIAVTKFMPCHLVSLKPRPLVNENEQLMTILCSQYVMICRKR